MKNRKRAIITTELPVHILAITRTGIRKMPVEETNAKIENHLILVAPREVEKSLNLPS